MPDFITLTCPSCGGKLKVTDQIHLLHCRNCGNEHMVVRDSGTMYLTPLAQDVRGIRVGVDKTAAELAITRLAKEISESEDALHTTMATTMDKWASADGLENFFRVTFLLSLLAGATFAVVGNGALSVVFSVLFVISLIGYIVVFEQRRARADKSKKEVVDRMKVELIFKQDQYKRNRQILDS